MRPGDSPGRPWWLSFAREGHALIEAAFWGLVAASALVIGAEIAFAFKLSRMAIGLVMAFGVGTLISSIAFELVEPSLALAEGWVVAAALGVGAVVFFLGDRAIARIGGSKRKSSDGSEDGEGSSDNGMGIALGSALVLVAFVEPAAQNAPGLGPVLVLALLVLHADGDAGRDVFESDGAADLIDILPAGTARSAHVLDHIIRGNLDVHFLRFGKDRDGGR